MGSGKILNIKHKYNKVNITGHVLDKNFIKSFYLIINGYFDLDYDDLIKLRHKISKTIKKNLNKELFFIDKFIDIEEIRLYEKWNYVLYEFTIFLLIENSIEFNDLEIESKKLTDIIYDTYFDKPEFNIK